MSNHSSQVDPELAKIFKRQLEQGHGLARQIQEDINRMGLGATGKFPEGQLTEADEGEIKIAITHTQGKVIIAFGTQVTWLGLTPELAEQLAGSLLEKAAQARAEIGQV